MGIGPDGVAADLRSTDHVASLQRGLEVMEILARNPDGMTLSEMAAAADLTRAAARRFLLTLTACGYATQAGRQFSLSPRLLSLARNWLGGASLWTYALPLMRSVAAEFNEACSAAVLDGTDVVYVARVPGRRILSVSLEVGTRLPAYCTSMGRVLLAGLSAEALDGFLATASLARRTPKTITGRSALEKAVARARAEGFAVADEELELGLRSIAVPVRNREGATVAALNVSTQSVRFSPDDLRTRVLPSLRRAAADVEAYFGMT